MLIGLHPSVAGKAKARPKSPHVLEPQHNRVDDGGLSSPHLATKLEDPRHTDVRVVDPVDNL